MSDFPAHSHQSLVNYCERCGTVLTGRQIEGKLLPACPACDHIAYLDPKVAAGVIFTLNGELVLLKRGIEPSVGKWVFPGGYVDRGEPVPVAAAREAREEVGMEIAVEDLIGDFLEVQASVPLVTAEMAHTHRAVGMVLKLVLLSEGLAADGSLARQLQRKVR